MDFFEVMLQETLSGGGGGDEPTGTVDIVQNGVTNVKSYASANVQVPNSYGVEDEGKVVSSGVLKTQTSKNINANGTVDTTENNSVVVAVPNTYAASDEGKVVDNGALVAQGSLTITENDTYDTTLISELIANISGGGSSVNILTGTDAPTSSVGSDGAIYLQYAKADIYEDSGLGWYAKKEYVVKDTTTKLWNSWVKSNTVPSIAVRYHYDTWYGAIQISTDADGVKHTSNTGSPAGSAVVDGTTWYISTDTSWSRSEGTTEVPSHNDTVRANGSYIQEVVERILSEADAHVGTVPQSEYLITNTYLKVNGAWQNLINSDIDDVDTGGMSDTDFEIDFTKIQKTNHNVIFDSDGAEFSTTNGFFSIQDLIDFYYDTNNGITIELDIASMQLPSSSSHQRFVMGSDTEGFIFRSTGVWAFYSGSWQNGTFEGADDGSFFDNCTLKMYRDTSLKWHFYKDGVLFFEPSRTLGLNTARIGSSSESIQNAVITKLRVYKGYH